ncbi:hypothetical protein [Vitiosangium sp. GDMCC 1.1324]|uniref:hypothetical protein n=1 Tax=Vitiosangium sp. (strain GDMCC 1.1324) TaxID=2138576 RepID=UPI000D3824B4|nr:hypothetical protein [Vitiosangium sp. GDMCC 1.1324]PTL82126.1 hypothetical protein DAT35_20205 [Vitiosangium sp. GDMCC 1.1324]
MPDFGSFDNYSDALLAACPLILKQPNAVAGRPSDPNFRLHWQNSREYCAWIYLTPDGKYEMSMLATNYTQDNPLLRQCRLPPDVEHSRYSADQIGYVFAVHNHPYPDELSDGDIRFIVDQGLKHGFYIETEGRKIPLGIVAFFSNSLAATCDGFYQYIPATNELLKWTPEAEGHWRSDVIGEVLWDNGDYRIKRR